MPQRLIAARLPAGTVDLTSTAQDRASAAIRRRGPKGAGPLRADLSQARLTIVAAPADQSRGDVPGHRGHSRDRTAPLAFRTGLLPVHRQRGVGAADGGPSGRIASPRHRSGQPLLDHPERAPVPADATEGAFQGCAYRIGRGQHLVAWRLVRRTVQFWRLGNICVRSPRCGNRFPFCRKLFEAHGFCPLGSWRWSAPSI